MKEEKLKLDQHFMINKEVIKRIVNYLEIKNNEIILEIGAGTGNLTRELKGDIIVVEIDKDLIKKLKEIKNIKIINDNILNCINKIKFDKIVGNIPYSICESLLNKLIRLRFKFAILTVPKKFIKRELMELILKEFFDLEILEEVKREDFKPKPKVDSIIIRLIPKKYGIFGEIYLQQYKKLKNAIKEAFCKYYKLTKKEALKKTPKLNFLNKKGFELNSKEWKEVYNFVK